MPPTTNTALQARRSVLARRLQTVRARLAEFDPLALDATLVTSFCDVLEAGGGVRTVNSLGRLLRDDVREYLRRAFTSREIPKTVRNEVLDVLHEVGHLYGPLGDPTHEERRA